MDSTALTGSPDFDVVVSLMGGTAFSGSDFVEVPGPAGLGAGNTLVGSLAPADTGDGEVETFTLGGAVLAQLAGLYDATGTPSQSEVFFRLSTSIPVTTDNDANNSFRYNLARDGDALLVSRSLVRRPARSPSRPRSRFSRSPTSLQLLATAAVRTTELRRIRIHAKAGAFQQG